MTYGSIALTFFLNTPWLQAILVVGVAYGLAKFISQWLPEGLRKLTAWLKFEQANVFIDLIDSPIFYLVFLLGLNFAVRLLELSESMEFMLVAGSFSLMIMIFSVFTLKVTKILLGMAAENPNAFKIIQPQTLPLFSNLALVIVIAGGFYFVFASWNVNMSALLASAGIVGLAVGMAAKDTLSDVIAGVLILTDSPYKVGDIVILEDGTRGRITHIGIRSTRLLTVENFDVTLPNSKIGNGKIVNESSNPAPSRMIAVDINLPYGLNMQEVREALLEISKECNYVLEHPQSAMKVIDLGVERVHYRLVAWISPKDNRYFAEFALNEMVYNYFSELKIPIFKPKENSLYVHEFPESPQELYIKEMPSMFGKAAAGIGVGGCLPCVAKKQLHHRLLSQKMY